MVDGGFAPVDLVFRHRKLRSQELAHFGRGASRRGTAQYAAGVGEEEIRADPVALTRLAADVLTSSQTLGDGWRDGRDGLDVPVSAYGNSTAASGVYAAHQAAAEDADVTIGRLVGVLEGDVDRLYRIAFAYQLADQRAAERQRRAGGHGRPVPE